MKAHLPGNHAANLRRPGQNTSIRADGRTPRSTSKAVIRLDTPAIRKKAIRAHRKAERAVEQLKADLKRYHEQDVPGFRSWLHRNFGHLLTRQRELQQAMQEKMAFAADIEEMVRRHGFSYPTAYRKVVWRRAHPDEAEAEDRELEELQREHEQARPADRVGNKTESDDEPDDGDIISDEEFAEWLEELSEEPHPPPHGRGSHPDQQTAKELYRNIVRQLHPDHHGQMTEARAALWHEAQEAYRRHDLSALHSVLARCEDGAAAMGEHTPVSLIRRMTQQLAAAARSIRSELRHVKQDPAWRYEDQLDDMRYFRKIDRELRDVLNKMQWTLDEINHDLASLEQEARRQESRGSRPKPKPPRRSQACSDDDLPF